MTRPGGTDAMQTRYSFGGDEHIFVEVDEEMSLEAFFKSLSMTNAVKESRIRGVTEICPANASFQIKFDPDLIAPDDMLAELKSLEGAAATAQSTLSTRIIEIPVFYGDPWTHETLMRFRERHQDPNGTDLDYGARINGYASVDDFIAAHAGSPWFVSMVGFVAGLPFMYQMVERQKQIQVPKYLRPRTDTPKLTVGHGGCFGCIYSVRGAGGYQMFGITPMPIYDPKQEISYLRGLPDVRDHADADLRPEAGDQLPARVHDLLQAGRHREVQAGRPRRVRRRGGGGRHRSLRTDDPRRRLLARRLPGRPGGHQHQASGGAPWRLRS